TLHGATERDALRELSGNVVCHELCIELGALDLLDVDPHFLARKLGKLVAELVYLGALLPDHDTRASGVNRDNNLPRLALDAHVRDGCVAKALLKVLSQQLVFLEELRKVPLGVPG